MSYDLMIFDPSDLAEFPSDPSLIVEAVNEYLDTTEPTNVGEDMEPTPKIKDFISEMEQMFGDLRSDETPWTMWPPSVSASGRHCTFNLGLGQDITNMSISFAQVAQGAGVVLIAPQGREGLLSAPGGGGLLDI